MNIEDESEQTTIDLQVLVEINMIDNVHNSEIRLQHCC